MDVDSSALITLVCAYKHLWIKYQELRYMEEHPDDDQEAAREAVFDKIYDIFQPALDALSEGRPVRELLLALASTVEKDKELPFSE